MVPPVNKQAEETDTPSNNLWIGNLSPDVSDGDLMGLFGKYGALHATAYSSRSFGFVYFKRIEDAKAALELLQGSILKGSAIKIEFARPAKPCKYLWVGGISPAISKEELEKEFLKFGKIEDFKFLRDRNTAFVEYYRQEDASQAMRNMNGRRIGGEQIRVDFLRSQPSRKEQWMDARDGKEGHFGSSMGPNDAFFGSRHLQHSLLSGGRKGESQPSNVLWVGYPPSVQIDEQMLHNAMILFGEIERIKAFPPRHYAFVEFRSIEEARRAKEGLQGRLFNDPRITIMFSSSDLAPGKDFPAYSPAIRGPRPDMLNPAQMDVHGHNRPGVPANFHGILPLGPNASMRPYGRGNFDPLLPASDMNDLGAVHNLQDSMGPNWRRPSSPAPGRLPSQNIRKGGPSGWDVYDPNQLGRDSKRSRLNGGPLPIDDASFAMKKVDDRNFGFDQPYGPNPVGDGGIGPVASVHGINRSSPVGLRRGSGQGLVDNDCIWRGIIAKGGTPVCNARCVPLGSGVEFELPEIVNCSARTGLDMLTKHYAEATGFEVVFFLPDSEDDFASYTEFLRYLGAKDRAGVAKFDDGTTLFLVPPSDFLKNVLKVVGPERLYGVVLKFSFQQPGSDLIQQQPVPMPSSQYSDRQSIRLQGDFNQITPKEEPVVPVEYNRIAHEDLKHTTKTFLPPATQSSTMHSAQEYSSSNNVSLPQAGVSLTPELIASLASLVPANSRTLASENSQQILGSSNSRPSYLASGAPDKGTSSYGWKHDQTAPRASAQLVQPFASQFNPPAQSAQVQSYASLSDTSSQPVNVAPGSTQIQDFSLNLPQQGSNVARLPPNFAAPSQGGQFAASVTVGQQYQQEVPPSNVKGYGMAQGADASQYSIPSFVQPSNPIPASAQGHAGSFSQLQPQPNSQPTGPIAAERVNAEPNNQMNHLQPVFSGPGQGASDVEADKNQRYQSTLQFAASLLLQIQQQQQQQQQTNATGGQGSGN